MKVEVIGETEDRITARAVEGSSAKYVPEGSILMVMRSGILRHSFPVAITDRVVTLNQDLRALTPHRGIVAGFVARYLALSANRVLDDCSKDGTTVNSIEVAALERVAVPVAPLPEQRGIVARIDALFAEIAEGEAALAAARKGLETFRRALLKAAVSGELTKEWRAVNLPPETAHDLLRRIAERRVAKSLVRGRGRRTSEVGPPEADSLKKLPDGWAWATVGQILAVGTGSTPSRGERSYWGNGSIPWFTSAATNAPFARAANEKITELALSETSCKIYPPGTLLVAMYGEGKTRGQITELVVSGACNQACAALVFDAETEGLRDWIKRWFESFYLQLRAQAAGGVQPNLNLDIVKSLTVPIPPPAEAAEILRRVSDALAAVADAQALLDAEAADAARLKQSILKAAFEGRLSFQDPADEPASALLARLSNSSAPAAKRGRGRLNKIAS
jgi:type I restriction enzyme S subunit